MNTGIAGAPLLAVIFIKDTENAVKMTADVMRSSVKASVDGLSKSTTHKFGVDLVGVIHPDITRPKHCHQIITGMNNSSQVDAKVRKFMEFHRLESTLNEGDVVPVVVGDIPMLMTMRDNKINCVSNVCTHQGWYFAIASKMFQQ